MNKFFLIFTILLITGSTVYSAEPVSAPTIPDDPDAAGQMLLQQSYQKTDMTEEEAKLRKKEFEMKEKAQLKELRAIEKVQNKKDKLNAKAEKKLQKALEYEKKIQYRIKKMEEKKKELETLVDPELMENTSQETQVQQENSQPANQENSAPTPEENKNENI